MQNVIADKVQKWASDELGDLDFNALHAEIEYLIAQRFDQYVPTTGPHPDFRSRLGDWLENGISEAAQKVLFRLIPHIFFLGREEFVALQRAALRGPISRWLVEQTGVSFDAPNLDRILGDAISQTWFCPITDSAHISDFYHANGIGGIEYRVEWRAMAALTGGDSTILTKHMTDAGLTRVVLIEDVVGSGSQMNDLRPLFATLPPTMKVLLVPLVVCPRGVEGGRKIVADFPNVSFDPVLDLPMHSFVAPVPDPNEPQFFADVRETIKQVYLNVSGGTPEHDAIIPYGPFGWRRTGALIVTYSNTPDNTLPIIQYQSDTWKPLFPRSSRVGQ